MMHTITENVFVPSFMCSPNRTMDFKEDEKGSEFVFNNPNEKSRCGCGESFMTSAMIKQRKEAEKRGEKPKEPTSCA